MHSRKHLDDRPSDYEPEEQCDAVHANAILASFSWVFGQACFQGKIFPCHISLIYIKVVRFRAYY